MFRHKGKGFHVQIIYPKKSCLTKQKRKLRIERKTGFANVLTKLLKILQLNLKFSSFCSVGFAYLNYNFTKKFLFENEKRNFERDPFSAIIIKFDTIRV